MTMISEAKARHSLAEVARRTGIEVQEGATEVKVYCPFPTRLSAPSGKRHQQMILHLDTDIWVCFSCEAHGRRSTGDVVQWVVYTETVSECDAVKILDSGRDLTNHDGLDNQRRPVASSRTSERPDLERTSQERVLEVLATAWGYYSGPGGHKKGVTYLVDRTIDVEVLEAHRGRPEVGHTPKVGRDFIKKMHEAGITDDELVDAGLVYRSTRGVYPVYRTRLLVACRDDKGRVIGLFGRDVTGNADAKYVNLRKTLVYTKSVNLYQPLPAPTDEHGQVVIVEGTLDAIAISVAAIEQHLPTRFCPVTQSGKTLSDAQLDTVLAMTPDKVPVVAFDGDEAGRAANSTLAQRITALGRECVVTDLPGGADPAEYLAEHGSEGLAAWTRFGALKADGSSTRPVYGPAFVVNETWRTECAKALDASEDGDPEWAEVLAKAEVEGLRMRGKLPETAHIRYDTQVAKTLARHAAFEAVRHVVNTLEDESPQARATVAAKRANEWLSRFPKANPAKVEPVLLAELVRAAGDDPDMAALLPKAVENFGMKPHHIDRMTEMGGWEPPLIEPPEAIGM